MAVPTRPNGIDENEELEEGLFEEEAEAWDDSDNDVPLHLLPLAVAAKSGDVDALRVALDNHIGSIDDPIEDGDTVLHLCCLYGSLSCVKLLVERGANYEVKDEEGAIPLHDACAGGYAEIVEFIISSAGNSSLVTRMLETIDTEGDTPLHHAARGEHLNVIQLLLSVGASPEATNAYGKTPAELADPGTEVRRVLEQAVDKKGMLVACLRGGACITLQYVSNVFLRNLHIHDCVPSGNANVRSSPTHSGFHSRSDGDGISIFGGCKIWIDHCSLSNCADGLIDAIMGSTGITISNNYFSRHNELMLLGHSDNYPPDLGMQVTIAFNCFGEKLIQRMPRCRLGYFHIVNNDFTEWEMYAIGGSGNPTVNSQGNRYIAPPDPNAKEVTKRVDTDDTDWSGWNWRSEGDVMVNGAFFVPSGDGLEAIYSKASSVSPKSAGLIDQLTLNAGVLGGSRDDGEQSRGNGGANSGGGSGGGGAMDRGGDGLTGYLAMSFGSGEPPPIPQPRRLLYLPIIFLSFLPL